ncbi:MBL fold metallo-hydrolase [Fusibacter ferrireducens]|uniref:MBL fold metallo-hydrolase n=1 Tax=Fusibacter ferrireducens TaxID=2785058 RepID=A0ABR9ZYW4_9FIRM|nr:MBL fold metallo-hydrolase [Fusibacter ferrireducens]MBF4695652.1 MBL fold metallo-hydrolase [Fusibacter ferrireducens]
MKINFLGAAGHVTGSMYLVETEQYRFLIDCGQFQGTLTEEQLNYSIFDFDPKTLDFMILSHAHVDHSGRIPLLVKEGFSGKIYCTYPTMYLADILLRDSGKIHESETDWENKKRERAGLEKVLPLFTEDDAVEAIQYLYPLNYNQDVELNASMSFKLVNAGHLLGSSSVVIDYIENDVSKRIVFSGDLGNSSNFLQENPETIEYSNFLVVESTYGNKLHQDIESRTDKLVDIILEAYDEGGTAIIPSFAVGRTQEIIFELHHYIRTHSTDKAALLNQIPIYVDSPLALDATSIYSKSSQYMSELIKSYGESPFILKNLHLINSNEESIALNKDHSPKVIISASGMCDAGRIKHHLKHNLWRASTHIIFIGYQAEETLGRAIKDGATKVRILDEDIAIKAHIHSISGFSGHADLNHLLQWVKPIEGLEKIFVTHGEFEASHFFRDRLGEIKSCDIVIPKLNDSFEI